ncbi:MAG: autotransporter-associated beta strand repeat-containing protein [Burkholderiales bacterium]|nr:autotransporter-associated beta strand repeat-containing protein [Phycisphaerae bacterium]
MLSAACAATVAFAVPHARAADGTFNDPTGGLWSDSTNWLGGIVASGATFTANFNTEITADTTVNLDSAMTIGKLTFNDTTSSNNWIIDNNGNALNVLTLDNGASQPTITVTGSGRNNVISAVIAGTNGFIKTGNGALTLSGNNTYSGVTRLNSTSTSPVSGDLYLGSDNALGTSTLYIDPGSTALARTLLNSGVTIANNITINTARSVAGANGAVMTNGNVSATINGSITINNKATSGGLICGPFVVTESLLVLPTNFLTINGAINLAASYTNVAGNMTNTAGNGVVIRSGNVKLSGGGNYNRIEQRNGTLQVGATNGINTGAYLDIGQNANSNPLGYAALDLNGFNQSLVGIQNSASAGGAGSTVVNRSETTAATLTLTPLNPITNPNTVNLAFGNLGNGASAQLMDFDANFPNRQPLSLVINGDAAGVQIMNTPNSSYHGTTTLTSGILSINTLANGGSNSSIGASTSAATNLVFGGGTLRYTGASVSTDRDFTTNVSTAGTIEVTTAANTLTWAGVGSGGGGLKKGGAGTLLFTGAHLYTGPTTVTAGRLIVDGSLSASSAVSVASAATLGGIGNVAGTVTPASGGIITPGNGGVGNLTTGALVLNTGSFLNYEFGGGVNDQITVANAGGLTLNGANLNLYNTGFITTFSTNGLYTLFNVNGGFTGDLGNLSIANPAAGKFYSLTSTASTIDLTIGDAITREWNNNAATALWTDGGNWIGGLLPNAVGETAKFGTALVGTDGTVTLNGNKTVSGLIFDHTTVSYNLTGAGSTLTLNNGVAATAINITNGTHTIAVPVALSGATAVTTTNATDALTISGSISGAETLTASGPGTLTLTGTNTYTATTVNTGTLNVGSGGTTGSLGSGATTLANAATINFNRSNAYNYGQTITGAGSVNQIGAGTTTVGAISGATTVNVSNGALVGTSISQLAGLNVTGTGSLTASGAVTGAGKLTVNTTGAVSLGASNSYTGGTQIDAGTLTLNAAGALPANSALAVNGGTLDLNANNISINNVLDLTTSTGVITNNGPALSTSTIAFSGNVAQYDMYAAINDGAAGGKVALTTFIENNATSQNGNDAQFRLAMHSPSTFSGGTTVNKQSIQASATNAFGTGPINFVLNNSSTNTSRLYIAGGITLPNEINIAQGNPFTGFGVLQYLAASTGSSTLSGTITISADNLNGGLVVGAPNVGDFLNITGAINTAGTATTVIQRGGNVKYSGGGNYPNLTITGLAAIGVNNGLNTAAAVILGAAADSILDLNGFNQTLPSIVKGGSAASVTNTAVGPATLTLNTAVANTYAGTLDGTLALTKTGADTLTLSGVNTYAGATSVSAGALNVTGTHSANAAYAVTGTGALRISAGGVVGASTLNSTAAVTNDGSLSSSGGGTVAGITHTAPGLGTTTVSGGTLNSMTGAHQGTLALTTGGKLSIAINGGMTGVSLVNAVTSPVSGANFEGTLELHDNDLIVEYGGNPSSYTDVLNMVKSGISLLGFGGNGTGITSAEVIAQGAGGVGLNGTMLGVIDGVTTGGQVTTLSGFTVPNPTQSVLVKYTWRGDANLDGVVNGSDYALADTGFSGGGTGWFYGDVNYDGVINGSDYALIDTGFSSQTGPLPEPAMLSLLGLGAMGMLRRRRRAV